MQENHLNPGGGGCGELTLRHCTPAWVTRARLRLKKKNKKTSKTKKQRDMKKLLEEMDKFITLIVIVDSGVYASVQAHQIVYIKYV